MEQSNEYDKQAEQFLQDTGTTFKADFLTHGIYFDGDKDKRDIYQITLVQGERFYSFKFGQSINASGKYVIDADCWQGDNSYSRGQRLHKKPFIIGQGKVHHINKAFAKPTPYDVLAALQKNDIGTLEDFCGDFGYNTDSISASKTYNAVRDEFLNIERLYNTEEIEQLQEIQ